MVDLVALVRFNRKNSCFMGVLMLLYEDEEICLVRRLKEQRISMAICFDDAEMRKKVLACVMRVFLHERLVPNHSCQFLLKPNFLKCQSRNLSIEGIELVGTGINRADQERT
jgi:hypothetical protein